MATFQYNPFGTAGTSGASPFKYSPFPKVAKSTPFTAQQYIKLQAANKKSHSESFFDEIKHAGKDSLHPVAWTFDKLLRPQYAVASAVDKGIGKGGSLGAALHAAREGFMGRSKEGFGQVLSHHGVLDGHGTLRGLAGFGLDIAGDPLTYVSGGAESLLAHTAEHAALIGAGKTALEGADHLDNLTAARDILAKGGEDYSARHALAAARVDNLKGGLPGEATMATNDPQIAQLSVLNEVAKAEQRRVEKALPQLSYGSRLLNKKVKITPTSIAGKRVVPALPKLDNFIDAGLPGSKLAEGFRNKFVRTAGQTPETHAAAITYKHLAEEHTNANLRILRDVTRSMPQLSKEEALTALHYGESTKNFIKTTTTGRHLINNIVIHNLERTGKLNAKQVAFLHKWHQATELLYQRDKQFGVDYEHAGEKSGQLYVPHLVDKSGNPLSDVQIGHLTKAGFQRSRKTSNFSVSQLHNLALAGKLGKDVETDPFKLLAVTARSRGTKQADMGLLNAYAKNLAINTRVVDEAKLAKNAKSQAGLTTAREARLIAHDESMSNAHEAEQQFLANHELTHLNKLSDLTAKVRSHKFRNNYPTKAANVARLSKRLQTLTDQHVKDLTQISKGKFKPLNDAIAQHTDEAANHAKVVASMDKQMKNLQLEEKKILKGKTNKAYDENLHTTVAGMKDKYGHPLAFPPSIAHAIGRYSAVASGDDTAVEKFAQTWRKWLANWKLGVTSINPGYRIRNTMSDVWSMYVSGMPLPQILHYGVKAQRLMSLANQGGKSAESRAALKFIVEAYHHGILSGLYQGDVQDIAKMLEYSGTKRSLANQGKFIKLSTKIMQEMNAHVENLGRLTHYMYRKEALGESTVNAAAVVKGAHFDYEDLTPFEQKYMKAIAPFYTWSRKNIPFQVKALIHHPGQFTAFPKLMEESEYASGGDKGNIVPGFIPGSFGFQIPFGKHNYYLPQIGATDLQVFDSKGGALNRLTGLANPAIRLPFELLANKNFFTGAQIASDTHTRNPVSPLGADLLKLIPGSNVGTTSRVGLNGKEVSGPGANPYYQYLLGQFPLSRELGISSGGIQRSKTSIPPEVSYLGGQSVQHVDPAQQKAIAQINLEDKVKKEIAGLRDAGRYPRAKTPKAGKHTKKINDTLNLNMGRR